ncbi:16396_t:CDS:2 [Acaulospora morrowiae]|uniref:16396_t:CDS:1 n=1 Tax=Acaulospora morrowiae TaxID=94023 RepID=A0A9N8V8X7_9GLOM|nr:16396_t:CDS:2 [Acaulospora morrowiae]
MSDLSRNCTPSTGYYTLVVGDRTFKLSTRALYSDAPNHFTHVFSSSLEEAMTKTMYIERDPVIFSDIVRHLQGYYITPRDEVHFTDLYIDAQYYCLPKLKAQLRAYCVVNVGGKVFRVEREILEKRDAPNFFTSFGFVHSWEPPATAPLIAIPPAIPPPILDRDPELFADILRYLQGYDIEIKDEVHRQNLLKDSRFYLLKGLTEKLLASTLTVNGFAKDDSAKNEILFRLKDIRLANILLPENNNHDEMPTDESDVISTGMTSHIMYKNREGAVYVLLIEVHNFHLVCHYNTPQSPFSFTASTTPTGSSTPVISAGRVSPIRPNIELVLSDQDIKKLRDIAKSIKASDEIVTSIQTPDTCAFEIDGVKVGLDALTNVDKLSHLIKLDNSGGLNMTLFVTRAILKLLVNNGKVEMELLKCESFSSERGFNGKREFLPSNKKICL